MVKPKGEAHVFSKEMVAFNEQEFRVFEDYMCSWGDFRCVEGGEARGEKTGAAGVTVSSVPGRPKESPFPPCEVVKDWPGSPARRVAGGAGSLSPTALSQRPHLSLPIPEENGLKPLPPAPCPSSAVWCGPGTQGQVLPSRGPSVPAPMPGAGGIWSDQNRNFPCSGEQTIDQ